MHQSVEMLGFLVIKIVWCAEIGFPRELRLERQLISSMLMSWSPPDHVPQAQIQSYHVYLDGQLKTTIRGNDRTKALLEKVDLTSVRHVTYVDV